MPTVAIQFGLQSNPSRHTSAGSARIYNLYLEPGGEESSAPAALWPVAGLASWSTLSGGGGIRAMLDMTTELLVVAGRVLFRVDTSGTATAVGGIPTDGPVYMDRNRADPAEVGIVSDGLFWRYVGGALIENTDVDLPPASSFAVLDGYGILPGYGNQWYITDADNFSSIGPLDFASAESSPDANVRVAVRESEVVLFGAQSTEWWQNTGAEGFPFSRVQTAGIGCLAARSVAKLDRTLIWVAPDFTVREMAGYGGKVISTYAVARDIEDETDKAGITATAWAEAGHWFYCVSGTSWTWVYDATTGKWHQRKSYGTARWKCNHVVSFAGMTLAGDKDAGTIYRMSRTTHTEGDDALVTEIIAPAAKAFPNDIIVDRLTLRTITGTGLVPGSSSTTEPVVMVEMSRDGGATFGSARHLSLGTRGDRTKVVESHRWGKAQSAVFRFTASAAVARGFLEASIDYTPVR